MDAKFVEQINSYLDSLEKNEKFTYFPTSINLTQNGKNLNLGFSCYALKCLFITKKWETLDQGTKDSWTSYINSYQRNHSFLPISSYIDNVFLEDFNIFDLKKTGKNLIKKSLSLVNLWSYESPKKILENNIRAETKQAISTLYQVDSKNNSPYLEFPKNEYDLNKFLNSFNWNRPWHAGAQFSSVSVFHATQLEGDDYEAGIQNLEKFINSKLDIDSGLYFENSLPSPSESINGAMKVLTGLDWLKLPIHKPKKLIDFCLSQIPSNEGCDLVDIIYVLYRCSKETNYKRNEISKYFKETQEKIFSHYKKDEGGFSYFLNKSQTNYYGLKISNGGDKADLHGTILLLWAVSMIYDFENSSNELFNILKP